MKIFLNKILKNKKAILSIFLFVGIGVFGTVNVSHADTLQAVANWGKIIAGAPILVPIGVIAALIVILVGGINSLVIGALSSIAQYNQFISEPTIVEAWVIIRDLCNMFFVLILLVIAFATILRVESYNVKKALPKLLIMAVLINFSRIIFGLIIDFAQVIMLTFVKAWGPASSFVYITKMKDFFSTQIVAIFSDDVLSGKVEFSLINIVAGMLMGILFMIISGIVLVVLLATLVMRIVMIWIYVVLSPFIFLGATFEPMRKYTSKIWEDFIKYVISGPILAFFIWLSLISVDKIGTSINAGSAEQTQCFGISDISCLNNLIPLIISIGMLIGGLMVTQQIGGAAGSIAGKGMAWARGAGATLGYKWPLKGLDWAQRKVSMSKLAEKAGVKGFDLAPTRLYKRVSEGLEDEKRKELDKMGSAAGISMKRGGFRGLLSSLSSPSFAKEVLDGPLALRGIKRVWSGGTDIYSNELDQASRHEAHANAAQKMKDYTDKGYDDERLKREFKQEDEYKKLKSSVGEQKADEYFNKIKGLDRIALNKEVKERKGYAMGHRETAAKYQISDAAGDKVFWNGIREAMSKTGQENEDAIAEAFIGAVEKKDWELASGLYLKACDVGGYNTLLQRTGYSSIDAGFTKEQAERLKNGTDEEKAYYEKYKGGNDMFRDVFMSKLGMDEERALSVQAEGAEICAAKGHYYGASTVAIKNGKRVQRNREEQAETTFTNLKKGDIEGTARKTQKAGYGGWNVDGEWESSHVGQDLMLHGWRSILKQIDIGRWNPSAAEEMGKKEEVKNIRNTFDKMVEMIGDEQEVIKMFGTTSASNYGKDVNIKQYFDIVEDYSHTGSGDMNKIIRATRKGEKIEATQKEKSTESSNTETNDKKTKTFTESSDEEQQEQWNKIFNKNT